MEESCSYCVEGLGPGQTALVILGIDFLIAYLIFAGAGAVKWPWQWFSWERGKSVVDPVNTSTFLNSLAHQKAIEMAMSDERYYINLDNLLYRVYHNNFKDYIPPEDLVIININPFDTEFYYLEDKYLPSISNQVEITKDMFKNQCVSGGFKNGKFMEEIYDNSFIPVVRYYLDKRTWEENFTISLGDEEGKDIRGIFSNSEVELSHVLIELLYAMKKYPDVSPYRLIHYNMIIPGINDKNCKLLHQGSDVRITVKVYHDTRIKGEEDVEEREMTLGQITYLFLNRNTYGSVPEGRPTSFILRSEIYNPEYRLDSPEIGAEEWYQPSTVYENCRIFELICKSMGEYCSDKEKEFNTRLCSSIENLSINCLNYYNIRNDIQNSTCDLSRIPNLHSNS